MLSTHNRHNTPYSNDSKEEEKEREKENRKRTEEDEKRNERKKEKTRREKRSNTESSAHLSFSMSDMAPHCTAVVGRGGCSREEGEGGLACVRAREWLYVASPHLGGRWSGRALEA